ncbi:MAG: hypothetical protein LH468_11125 [Nocardioides sp.]|nr:hypothetical protein [Nocardioides sp.]
MSRVEVRVPARFCGPRASGNGGWSAGALAEVVGAQGVAIDGEGWPVTTVQLRQPPPLDVDMVVGEDGSWTTASDDTGATVLRARLGDPEPEPVPFVDLSTARAAEASYPGLVHHPFPTCFVCGTGREVGDGLRIFSGPVTDVQGAARVAATWTPAEARLATTWAAIDCPGAWSLDIGERLMVLGQMTARVHRLPEVGAPHVVVGLAGAVEGRKNFSRTSLYDADGDLLATSEQVWISIDAAAFA